ncbi:MAG: hypothetical protein U0R69_10015 [Gaiellales bacterium]
MAVLTPAELSAARLRSGRLGGRPKLPTVAEARAVKLEALVPKALLVLEDALRSDDERVALVAAREVLDRAWGKASARLEVSQGEPLTSGMSQGERVALLASLRGLLAEREAAGRPAVEGETVEGEVVDAP